MTGVVTFERRQYRARVATRGADVVEGNVAFELDLGILSEAPVGTGQVVHPIRGATDMLPFQVQGIDRDGFLTASYTAFGRWAAIGRLTDVQFRTVAVGGYGQDGGWHTYATGRCSDIDELDGPGKFRIQIADESWKARVGTTFEHADTTQLWPTGIRFYWRGFERAAVADGTRCLPTCQTEEQILASSVFRVRLIAAGYNRFTGTTITGVRITQKLLDWIRADALPEEERGAALQDGRGCFRTLRMRYGGQDYEIITFGSTIFDLFTSLVSPENVDGGGGSWAVAIHAILARPDGVVPPESTDEAYLYAPTAAPSEDLPLHIGVDGQHTYGNDGGWIHLADLTRRVWQDLDVVYSEANLAAFESDLSFPALSPRVLESPADPERWMQDHIWGPFGVAAGRDAQGRRILIDLRPPTRVPANTPVIDHTNAQNVRWRVAGREMINTIVWWFVQYVGEQVRVGGSIIRRVIFDIPDEEPEDLALDGLRGVDDFAEPVTGDPDAIADSGTRQLLIDGRAAAHLALGNIADWISGISPIQRLMQAGRGATIEKVRETYDENLLATYQDGLLRISGEIHGAFAKTLAEGDLIWVDAAKLQLVNPGRVGASLPPGAGPVVPGEEPEFGDAPDAPAEGSITVDEEHRIAVTVASVTAGRTVRVEYAITGDDSAPPAEDSHSWRTIGTLSGPGTVTSGSQTQGLFAWIRLSEEEDGVRVTEYSTPVVVEIEDGPRLEAVTLVLDRATPVASWRPSPLTGGVRVLWVIYTIGAEVPAPTDSMDFHRDTRTFQFPDLEIGQAITVDFQAWSDWSAYSGTVAGEVGEVVTLTRHRRRTLGDEIEETGGGDGTFLGLTDTPESYAGQSLRRVRVNAAGTALEFTDAVSGEVDTLLDLTDTPASYSGQGGKTVRVKGAEDGVEFTDSDLLALTDTPASYSGQGGKVVAVKSGEDGVEFVEAGGGGEADSNFSDGDNVVIDSTDWMDVNNDLDLVVAASAGDILLVGVSFAVLAGSGSLRMDYATIVSGSPVNYISGSTADVGVAGWRCVNDTNTPGFIGRAGAVMYQVVAGDISGGNVRLRLRSKVHANSRTVSQASGLQTWVYRLP